jgi:predicted methyltransferase MtxX (methanogen marker protein 4)
MGRPGKVALVAFAVVTTVSMGSCRSKADFDRNNPQAVRRALVADVRALEKVGIVVDVVDTTDRVRVLVEDLTDAKREALQRRYGPLIDVETAS